MSIAESPRITARELENLPDGDRFELIDGELVEREPMGLEAGYVASKFYKQLDDYAEREGGFAFGDGNGFRAFGEGGEDLFRPDACYVSGDRMPTVPVGFGEVAPDVVVEVVSPSDRLDAVEEKVQKYLAAGTRIVWVAFPRSRTIDTVVPGGRRSVTNEDERLSGGDVLPGFEVAAADLFPPRSPA